MSQAPPLILNCPMRGWVAPLDEAPDPVFAERMLGDGLAIDPTGSSLHAPCAGVVLSVHPACHAVSLRVGNDAEILMHIGIDTVALNGEGLTAHVRDGQAVSAGDLLISFDIDLMARRARSLMTPVILTNGEAFVITRRDQDRELQVGDFLMEIQATGAQAASAETVGATATRLLTVPLAHGIHARPAAVIAAEAKRYAAEIGIEANGRRANAKSPVAVMALAIRQGDAIVLTASGADADPAVAAVAALIASGLGEGEATAAAPPPPPPQPAPPPPVPTDGSPLRLKGVVAAPGLAIGVAVQLVAPTVAVNETSLGVAHEAPALEAAIETVRAHLEARAAGGSRERRAILGAHLAFLDDPELIAAARAAIDQGRSAGVAWREAIGGYVEMLRASPDPRLAARADDLCDLERQVLMALGGVDHQTRALPEGAILLADDLLPSELLSLDAGHIAGLCMAGGGPTSHVAILAAAMNVPALVAAGPGVLAIKDGTALILDADRASLQIAPDPAALEAAEAAIAARRERRTLAQAAAFEECRTADGARVEVFANVGSLSDAKAAAASGAEGCGLLRTEFLFLDRPTPPSEDEQAAEYQAIATALGGLPLIVRTLDVGGDKAVDYLPIPAEENPALGLRGIRVSLWRPDLLRQQVRAILRVTPHGQCRIMAPMVASLAELEAVRAMVDEVRAELSYNEPVAVGVMIETPAAAVTADMIGARADFLSIGTNDLTQYTLAMDRGNPQLAAQVDGLHPAVLRLIALAAGGAARHERPLCVCGGLASDLAAVPILIGLGVNELSAMPAVVAELKGLVRTLSLPACRALARQALDRTSAAEVRALAAAFQASQTGASQ
jgi:phosphoenolpyruvate-protein phosphotransferase